MRRLEVDDGAEVVAAFVYRRTVQGSVASFLTEPDRGSREAFVFLGSTKRRSDRD